MYVGNFFVRIKEDDQVAGRVPYLVEAGVSILNVYDSSSMSGPP